MGAMINRWQSLNLFWRVNLTVLLFLLALAPISYLIDDQLFLLINQDAGCSYLDKFILYVNNYGLAVQLLAMTVPLACFYSFRILGRNSAKKGIILLIILFFAFLSFYCICNEAVGMIKEIVQRPRPYLELEARVVSPMSAVHDYHSFPSGHASSSFFLFCITIYFLHKLGECMKLPEHLILVVIICSSGLAVSRAIARIYLGYHYPSDIVFGAIFGLMFAIAGVTSIEWLARRSWGISG